MLSRREAAQLIGTSEKTLQRWAARGEGPPRLKFGRRMTRYQLGVLRRWLELENFNALKQDSA